MTRLNKKNERVPIMVVYMTCKEKKPFPAEKFGLPTYNIKCNETTNPYDCREAVPYLNFIIDNYDNPLADKFIFVHGHETAWHYNTSVFEVVNKTIKTKEFQRNNYGGLYKRLWHNFVPWVRNKRYADIYPIFYGNMSMAPYQYLARTSFPCCASFYVNSSNFKIRPKWEFITLRNRLTSWSRANINNRSLENPVHLLCSTLMEHTWHILLGNTTIVSMKGVLA